MKFLHTMLRVKDLDRALDFFVTKLGLIETRRQENEMGKFTLVFLATAPGEPEVELTYNWGSEEEYTFGRNFGHLAFQVENIYETCERLQSAGVTILRPPRDGYMAFIKSPDNQSVELLQKGSPLPPQAPWKDMTNTGSW
ncbi:lactoylglutathione lyase [Bdellovibrio bacteriovorus W]|nr:lactoylglutathione lyase [Bdellovibrio bacteriovorus W]